MKNTIARYRRRFAGLFGDTRGANMVEYMVIVGVVALLAIGAFTKFGGNVKSKITEQGGAVSGINGAAGGQ